ncbi:16S rRNA pseudouridine(516) synthase [Shewanella maritima]|uniref:16S rRNA pseudouridine(516) synthase n=1 Tax=Shewanella maritima TaxID=2520507 RepID=UPI003736FB04
MAKRGRLDQFIAKHLQEPKKRVRQWMRESHVVLNEQVVFAADTQIDEFDTVVCHGQVLQQRSPCYYLLHKPDGVVSATKDTQHPTALALLDESIQAQDMLHIAGRLDLHSTGALLITNDARWSQALMSPQAKLSKHYLVTLANPIDESYVSGFAKGMYFEFEDITTQPAILKIVSEHQAIVELQEGKYHQIKRMFGRFRNPVVGLHRFAIGNIQLGDLPESHWRALTPEEVQSVWQNAKPK